MGNGQSVNAAKRQSLRKLTDIISPVPADIDVAQRRVPHTGSHTTAFAW
jgi:formate--tetrahydrofolate ligase